MKLKPICDCDDNKIILGQMDGEMIWREKTSAEKQTVIDMSHTWKSDEWMRDEAYKANTD